MTPRKLSDLMKAGAAKLAPHPRTRSQRPDATK